jgi:hypothetical protein
MYSDEQLAVHLKSMSQGRKINVVKLQQRTELYYSKDINEFDSSQEPATEKLHGQ